MTVVGLVLKGSAQALWTVAQEIPMVWSMVIGMVLRAGWSVCRHHSRQVLSSYCPCVAPTRDLCGGKPCLPCR